MPQGGPPLPDADIETIKNWILDGALDWAALPIPSVNHAVSETADSRWRYLYR